MNIYERFIKYIKIDTQSDENSTSTPSSLKQLNLANQLKSELDQLKIDCFINKGTLYGRIPANCANKKRIGLIAHLDTSPDFSGSNVNPRLIKNYQGGIITLNEEKRIELDPNTFNTLLENINEDLIVTDGNSLLGADDKAGISIIMEVINYLTNNKDILHGDIYLAFTPDEEIGKGTDYFDYDYFKVDYAYTLDGGDIKYIEYETFNAASAKVEIVGKNIHPGSAKSKMINSIRIACEFDSLLPTFMRPEYTEMYEGFNHLNYISGSVEKTTLDYIIRNHDENLLKKQKADFENAAIFLNNKYGFDCVKVTIKDSYSNMAKYINNNPECLYKIFKAYENLGIKYSTLPIRGGTDGANLSKNGIPCPNLGNGGYNFHGKYEYLSLTQANKMCDILLELIKIQ